MEFSQRDKNALIQAITYSDYNTNMLAKFYNVKSLLYNEMLADPEYYHTASLLPDPMKDKKINAAFGALEKKYVKGKTLVDACKTGEVLPEEATAFLKGCSFEATSANIFLCSPAVTEYELKMPRGIYLHAIGCAFGEKISIYDCFNIYPAEGFRIAYTLESGAKLAIEPSALDGIKGKGEVFVYYMKDNTIYKDFASRYFDVSCFLEYYKG